MDDSFTVNGFMFCTDHGSELCNICGADYRMGNNYRISDDHTKIKSAVGRNFNMEVCLFQVIISTMYLISSRKEHLYAPIVWVPCFQAMLGKMATEGTSAKPTRLLTANDALTGHLSLYLKRGTRTLKAGCTQGQIFSDSSSQWESTCPQKPRCRMTPSTKSSETPLHIRKKYHKPSKSFLLISLNFHRGR